MLSTTNLKTFSKVLTTCAIFIASWCSRVFANEQNKQSVFDHHEGIDINTVPYTSGECLQFSSKWLYLGPFQTGTREAEWGADPLEKFGGFRNLTYDSSATFRSSLAGNGEVSWMEVPKSMITIRPSSAEITIDHDDVDWNMMRATYGWAGMQFQGWARGKLAVSPNCVDEAKNGTLVTIILHVKNILELWVDGTQHFGGDVYAYGRAGMVLHLAPGEYQIDVKVLNDIRMFGGRLPPRVEVEIIASLSTGSLTAIEAHAVVPDIAEGFLVSPWLSIPLLNEAKTWIEVADVSSSDDSIKIDYEKSIHLAPGQTRPIKFQLSSNKLLTSGDIYLIVHFTTDGSHAHQLPVKLELNLSTNLLLSQKYTYLHPSGIVSYGILRPPPQHKSCRAKQQIAILLALHGAGVDADSPMSRNSYDGLPYLCAWIVIPSGVTSWSGDDWHNWGLADAKAAISAIPSWIESVKWSSQAPDLDKWFITGHSNGGQGAWYALTHLGDRIIGGAPLSGYLSIAAYVSYTLWHDSDPRAIAVMMSSMSTFKHELLVENLIGIPIVQVHGNADDNVPVYHSRRMFQLLKEATIDGNADEYSAYHELSGKGHWFEGIVTYGKLGEFLMEFFDNPPEQSPNLQEVDVVVVVVVVVVANPGDIECQHGICIDQLIDPGSLGRVEVKTEHTDTGPFRWISTSNIRRLKVFRSSSEESNVRFNGKMLSCLVDGQTYLISDKSGSWTIDLQDDWLTKERHGRQLGTMHALLNSRGSFIITVSTPSNTLISEYKALSLDISRNMLQYLGADTELNPSSFDIVMGSGNVIFLGIPAIMPFNFPLSINPQGTIALRMANGQIRTFDAEPGIGAIFLIPLPNERVGLVVWGTDSVGLRKAARLIPMRTGVGQPDFVILGPKSGWKGMGGVLAMGTFDSEWEVAGSSYVT